jgi:hypothetical protein
MRSKYQKKYAASTRGKRMRMLEAARIRAKRAGVPCTIGVEDIIIPDACPFLGTPLVFGTRAFHDASPSLDRLRPELGYVPGNVIVCSHRANWIKHNATPDELEQIAAALRLLLNEP